MFFPYKVDVPMARMPLANWVLMGLTILISIAMFGPLREWDQRHDPFSNLPEEVRRQLPEEIRALEQPAGDTVADAFILQPKHFRASQLVGNLFIHAGIFHLAGNMLFLFVFGNAVNAKLGHVKYILLYLGVGIIESLVWLAFSSHPCLGASGAIMGIVGAFLLLYPLNDVTVAYWLGWFWRGAFDLSAMWVIAAYVAMDVWGLVKAGNDGIGYLAHVAGFAAGALATAAILRFKLAEMERGEKSLLQVWKWMPFEDEEEKELVAAGKKITTLEAYQAARQASATRAARPAKKKDEGPIPFD